MKLYRCKFCSYSLAPDRTKSGVHSPKYRMGLHYQNKHEVLLPPGMDGFRFFYYTQTGKDHGSCVICHNETDFNRTTMKYSRFCNNPACKQKYKEEVDQRMIGKYGKVTLLNDPEQQKKMLAARRISGEYLWSDNKTKIPYVGSYELDFFRFLDRTLDWPVSDLIAPSPHTYTYEYQGKSHFYIPDAFIPSLNLEVEIKDGGSATRISKESREKDVIKDTLMRSCSNLFNYIKIDNKDYSEFRNFIKGE